MNYLLIRTNSKSDQVFYEVEHEPKDFDSKLKGKYTKLL